MTCNYERITERARSQRVLGGTTLKVRDHPPRRQVAGTKRIQRRRHEYRCQTKTSIFFRRI
jgi:hypothetical protein